MSKVIENVDWSGAQLRRVRLRDATFRGVDLSNVTIEGCDLEGLRIEGLEIGPLIEAERVRRQPGRALRQAADPAGLRAAWEALEQAWAETYARVAAMPAGTVDASVGGEWSFVQTLRHLVFANDGWFAPAGGEAGPFHAWGLPFTSLEQFAGCPASALGIDLDATPTYAEVLELRAERVTMLRRFLAEATPAQLAAELAAPIWDGGEQITVLQGLGVILEEEWEHLRFATRDLDALAAAPA